MKKLLLFLTGCLIVFSFSTIVYSGEGMYMSGNLGYTMLNDSDLSVIGDKATVTFDDGFAGGIALGYGFSKNIRVEGELAYQENDVDTGSYNGDTENDLDSDVTSLALLCNSYYDFENSSSFTPFITAGIGVANINVSTPIGDAEDTVFAYQVGGGVAYDITEKTALDLTYRYFATEDPSDYGINAEYASHNFYVGLRYNF